MLLGMLALWQNQEFKEETNQKDKLLIKLETEKIRLEHLPQFFFKNIGYSDPSIRDFYNFITGKNRGSMFSKYIAVIFTLVV